MQLRDPHRKTLNLKSKLSTLYAYYGNRKSHIKGKKMFFNQLLYASAAN